MWRNYFNLALVVANLVTTWNCRSQLWLCEIEKKTLAASWKHCKAQVFICMKINMRRRCRTSLWNLFWSLETIQTILCNVICFWNVKTLPHLQLNLLHGRPKQWCPFTYWSICQVTCDHRSSRYNWLIFILFSRLGWCRVYCSHKLGQIGLMTLFFSIL